jgi:hypothetical protein
VRLLTRTGFLIAVAALVAVLPTAAGALPQEASTPTAAAVNSATFEDSTGENSSAPDIARIVVSNTDVGLVSFRVNIPNRPQLGQDMLILLYVDTDNNAQTGAAVESGEPPGTDYVIELIRGEAALYRWDGTAFTRRVGDPPFITLSFAYANSGITMRINRTELGNTTRLRFYVFALSGLAVDPTTGESFCQTPPCPFDDAPGGGAGLYPYQVIVAKPTLQVRGLATTPKLPIAGKRFTMKVSAIRSDTKALVRNGRVTCRGRAGKAVLKAQVARVVGGAITCTWLIPVTAKGKTFRGSAAVRFEGLTATRSFSARIR